MEENKKSNSFTSNNSRNNTVTPEIDTPAKNDNNIKTNLDI